MLASASILHLCLDLFVLPIGVLDAPIPQSDPREFTPRHDSALSDLFLSSLHSSQLKINVRKKVNLEQLFLPSASPDFTDL